MPEFDWEKAEFGRIRSFLSRRFHADSIHIENTHTRTHARHTIENNQTADDFITRLV